MLTTAFVYSPVASEPWELISPMSKHPRPIGFPTALRPFTTPGPGTAWAFTKWDQDEIWYKPPEKLNKQNIRNMNIKTTTNKKYVLLYLHIDASLCSQCQQIFYLQIWESCVSQTKPAVSGWRLLCSPVGKHLIGIRKYVILFVVKYNRPKTNL